MPHSGRACPCCRLPHPGGEESRYPGPKPTFCFLATRTSTGCTQLLEPRLWRFVWPWRAKRFGSLYLARRISAATCAINLIRASTCDSLPNRRRSPARRRAGSDQRYRRISARALRTGSSGRDATHRRSREAPRHPLGNLARRPPATVEIAHATGPPEGYTIHTTAHAVTIAGNDARGVLFRSEERRVGKECRSR